MSLRQLMSQTWGVCRLTGPSYVSGWVKPLSPLPGPACFSDKPQWNKGLSGGGRDNVEGVPSFHSDGRRLRVRGA